MTWRELSNFLNSQRMALAPRPISEFAQIGEKAADTFKRLEKQLVNRLTTLCADLPKQRIGPRLRTSKS